MKKIIGIYKIISPTGRIYVGQSVNINKRFSDYKYKDVINQVRLCASFNKYGVDAHIFEIIEECEFELLNIRERYWQDHYNVLSRKGLNCVLTETDEQPRVISEYTREKMKKSALGKVFSDESKKKMSEAQKRNMTDEKREYLKKLNLGRKHTEEQKRKISEKNKGKKVSEETKIKISEKAKGRKISEETRKKMSERAKNISNETRKKMSDVARNRSEDTRRKMSDAKKGKKATEETRKKMSKNSKRSLSKMVINLENGFFYDSATLAFESQSICKTYGAFRAMLNGGNPNKTNYEYVGNIK
jgi:group I intron endonuclease